MYRKVIIAVDCTDDAQQQQVQQIMQEVSNMGLFSGEKIISAYPYFRAHRNDLTQLFGLISKGGVKSLMSGQGISLVTKLAKR